MDDIDGQHPCKRVRANLSQSMPGAFDAPTRQASSTERTGQLAPHRMQTRNSGVAEQHPHSVNSVAISQKPNQVITTSKQQLSPQDIWRSIKAEEDKEEERHKYFAKQSENHTNKINALYKLLDGRGGGSNKRVQELEQELANQKRENALLKEDLTDLKQKIATLSTTSNEIADDQLRARMEDIYQLSASWVRTNFRKQTKSQDIARFLP